MKSKKILIELPTWLGDSIMTTPAICNIIDSFKNHEIILFGSFVSIAALQMMPNIKKTIIDDSKKTNFRLLSIYKLARDIGKVDIAFSFRKSTSSKIFMFFINADKKYQYKRVKKDFFHQVEHYNNFINFYLKKEHKAGPLKLFYNAYPYKKPTLGINAGATYGSAKRWDSKKFAQTSAFFANRFDIVIFGSKAEQEIAYEIEDELKKLNIKNYQNLAGKTTIEELISKIASLSMFITNDSGPMHIAAAYKVPTVAIFGPTKYKETSQWQNPLSKIVRIDLKCSPCMKRTCPLGHHNCMKMIDAHLVIKEIKNLLGEKENV